MNILRNPLFWVLFALLFFASPALAQESVGLPKNGGIQDWIMWGAALLVPIASILAMIFPDGHPVMKVVNFFALNLGKARNDPESQ